MARETPEASVLSSVINQMGTPFPSGLCLKLHRINTGMGIVMPCLEAGEWIFDSVYSFCGCQQQSRQHQRGVSPGRAQSQLEVPENSMALSQAVG